MQQFGIKVACNAPHEVNDWVENMSDNKKRQLASTLYLHKKHGTLSETLALVIIQAKGTPTWVKHLDIDLIN